jgi:hypothetical protein
MTAVVLRIHEDVLRAELLPKLMGQVFDVTTQRSFSGIRRSGSIKANQGGELAFTYPQSQNSYFRKKGCVCLFDLRLATAEQVDEALHKYYFLNPSFADNRPVFLILGQACRGGLIPWSESIPEEGCRAMVLPHVEAGYPSEVPLALIDWALVVQVKQESDLQRLRDARRRRLRAPNEKIPRELFTLMLKASRTEAEERELRRWKAAFGPQSDALGAEEV